MISNRFNIDNQEARWEELPDELLATMLTFLSRDEQKAVMPINRRMELLAKLAVYFDRCQSHPQACQANSLSHYLVSEISQDFSLGAREGLEKIQAYFDQKFGQYAVNLCKDYEALWEQLFTHNNRWGKKWIYHRSAIQARFYPFISSIQERFYPFYSSSQWIENACMETFLRAKKIREDYQVVFNGEEEKSSESLVSEERLPPCLPSSSYMDLDKFLRQAHFLEELWSDMAVLNGILRADIQQVMMSREGNYNQIIIDIFNNAPLTENISPAAIYFLKNMLPEFFSTELLIEHPSLFLHFNRLSMDQLIFCMQHSGGDLNNHLNFLKKVVGKEEIRRRLKSHHYLELTRCPEEEFIGGNNVGVNEAAAILSVAEVIPHLTDNDLLVLVDGCRNEILPYLIENNPAFKERMTQQGLWFKWIINFNAGAAAAKTKAIYDLLSVEELKYLIKERFKHRLLLDDDVYHKLKNAFTAEEIDQIRDFNFFYCSSMMELNGIVPNDDAVFHDYKTRVAERVNGLIAKNRVMAHDALIPSRHRISPVRSPSSMQPDNSACSKEWQVLVDIVERHKHIFRDRQAEAVENFLEVLKSVGEKVASDRQTYKKDIEIKIINSLRKNIVNRLHALKSANITAFQQEAGQCRIHWGWRTIIGALVGAVIGIAAGAMAGAWAGPLAAATALMGGAKGAVIGTSLAGTTGLITGSGLGFWCTPRMDKNNEVKETINEVSSAALRFI